MCGDRDYEVKGTCQEGEPSRQDWVFVNYVDRIQNLWSKVSQKEEIEVHIQVMESQSYQLWHKGFK